MSGTASRSLTTRVESLPLIRRLLRARYDRHFEGDCPGCFRGVFGTFSEAWASAPKTMPHGFDCPEYATEFRDRHHRIFSFDYPMLFWLRPLLTASCRIFDFGGHLGTHYYAYAHYAPFPRDLDWLVCDLPEITHAGEALARTRHAAGLRFTNDFQAADGAHVLMAAGSIQYVESPSFASLLGTLAHPPGHLLINKLPLYDGPQFVTLQNGGVAFHPQYVFNRKDFIASITPLGYELADSWAVDSHSGEIPFHPNRSFRSHTGLYFRRTAPIGD